MQIMPACVSSGRPCRYFATKTTPYPAEFLLYGCRKRKGQTFGLRSDFYAMKDDRSRGVSAAPDRCKDFELIEIVKERAV